MTTDSPEQENRTNDRSSDENSGVPPPGTGKSGPSPGEGLELVGQFVQGKRMAREGDVVTGIKHLSQDNLSDLLDVASDAKAAARIVARFPDLATELLDGKLYKPGGATISAALSEASGTTRSGAFHGSPGGDEPTTTLSRSLAVGHLERGGLAVQLRDGGVAFVGDQDRTKFLDLGARVLLDDERNAIATELRADIEGKGKHASLSDVLKAGNGVQPSVLSEGETTPIPNGRGTAPALGGENAFRVHNFTEAEQGQMVQAINPNREDEVIQYLRTFRCKKGEPPTACRDRMVRLGKERFK